MCVLNRSCRWLAILGLFLAAAGCSEEDMQRISRVGGKTFDRAQGLALEAGERMGISVPGKAPPAPREEDLAVRVRKRLHWDQQLEGSAIQVAAADKIVTLKGIVRGDSQKARALELAGSTVGVESVKDELKLE